MTTQFRNLVFEGGGMKGLAYVGAMQVLEEKGYLSDIKRVGGTSAGAINALIFALGYSVEEQREIIESKNFKEFMDDSKFISVNIRYLLSNFGWNKGDEFLVWIEEKIEGKLGKKKATFQDLINANRPALYVTGTNLSTGYVEFFSHESHPNMPIADALRITMAIPIYFSVIRFSKDKDCSVNFAKDKSCHIFVDGGVILNYPIKLFDREEYIDNNEAEAAREVSYYNQENEIISDNKTRRGRYIYNCQTLGLRLDTEKEIAVFRHRERVPSSENNQEEKSEEELGKVGKFTGFIKMLVSVIKKEKDLEDINKFTDYLKALVSAARSVQENQHLHSDDWHRTMYIDILKVKTTDFNISDEMKIKLVKQGVESAEEYFRWFDNPNADPKPANKM